MKIFFLALFFAGFTPLAFAHGPKPPRCYEFPWPGQKRSQPMMLIIRETSSRVQRVEARLKQQDRVWQRGFYCLPAKDSGLDCIGADDSGRFRLRLNSPSGPEMSLNAISFGDSDEPGPSFSTNSEPTLLQGARAECPRSL